jgi:hypothetical protein
LKSFQGLQSYLCSKPIVNYLQLNRPYALIVNDSLGVDKKPGAWCHPHQDKPGWAALCHHLHQQKGKKALIQLHSFSAGNASCHVGY